MKKESAQLVWKYLSLPQSIKFLTDNLKQFKSAPKELFICWLLFLLYDEYFI